MTGYFEFQFLKKHDDRFVYNPASNWVSLKTYGSWEDYSSSDTTVEDHGKAQEEGAKETTESGRKWKRLVFVNLYDQDLDNQSTYHYERFH